MLILYFLCGFVINILCTKDVGTSDRSSDVQQNTFATQKYAQCNNQTSEWKQIGAGSLETAEKIGEGKKILNSSTLCASILEKSQDSISIEVFDNEGSKLTSKSDIHVYKKRDLIFPEIPKGKEIRIHDVGFPRERFLLSILSGPTKYLHLDVFPLELFKLMVKSPISVNIFIFQFLKTEWHSLLWIILWGFLTLCLPLSILAQLCCPVEKMQQLRDDSSASSVSTSGKWIKHGVDTCLHLLLLVLFGTAIIILFTNEEISSSITDAPSFLNIVIEDTRSFIDNTQTQMSFVINSSANIAIDAIKNDLNDIEDLLGQPFQRELALETGVDVALTALEELQNAVWKAGIFTFDLLNECESAHKTEILLQEKMKVLAKQLMLARYQCFPRDRNLCDTLQPVGFEVSLFVTNISTDLKLKNLQQIGKDGELNATIKNAIETFKNIPHHVHLESVTATKEIRTVLNRHRIEIQESLALLKQLSRMWSTSLNLTKHKVSHILETVVSQEIRRWIAVLCTSSGIILVWMCMICGAPCGCNYTPRSIGTLRIGLCFSCIVCLLLWITGSFSFSFGTNGQIFLCLPLYNYTTLGKILDFGGILHGKGILEDFAVGSENIRVEEVLEHCRKNRTAYRTFRLNDTFNLNKTNYRTWTDFSQALNRFSFGSDLEILTPELQLRLHDLSSVMTVNLTKHRTSILGPVTKRDLNSFEDQLNAVSRKLSDLSSVKRIEDLSFETKKIIIDAVKPLEALRDSILYKITALEILLTPLSKELNQTMSHLKTIQYFFDNQGSIIAEKNAKQYRKMLELYLRQMHHYIDKKVEEDIGKCETVWKIFDEFRYYICSRLVNPMNALSFCAFLCILLLLLIAHVVIKIMERYKNIRRELSSLRLSTGQNFDREVWASPSSICSRTTPTLVEEETTWTDPNPRENFGEHLIPPTPIVLQTMQSRVRTPRGHFESLKLVQLIYWKRSLSPRNWL